MPLPSFLETFNKSFIKSVSHFYNAIPLSFIIGQSFSLNTIDCITTYYYLSVYHLAVEKNLFINFFINEIGLLETMIIKFLILFPIVYFYLSAISHDTCKKCFLAFNLIFLFICGNNISWILKLWWGG